MAKSKTNLVIVESPAKARTIEKYLGPEYSVVASMGHLRDLPKSVIGVDIENGFEPLRFNYASQARTSYANISGTSGALTINALPSLW